MLLVHAGCTFDNGAMENAQFYKSSAQGDRSAATMPLISDSFDPYEFISSVPSLLGFYPAESVVLAGFVESSPTGHSDGYGGSASTAVLGPVGRVDIDDAAGLREIAEAFSSQPCILVLAVVVSEFGDSEGARAVEALEGLYGVPIALAWTIERIEPGQTYRLLHMNRNLAVRQTPAQWRGGCLGGTLHTKALHRYAAAGVVPELSREDLYASFEPEAAAIVPPVLEHEQRLDRLEADFATGRDLDAVLSASSPRELVPDVAREFHEAVNGLDGLAQTEARLSGTHCQAYWNSWERLWKLCASDHSRDLVFYELFCEWGDDVADPVSDAPYRDALLALSRIARGSARSNALCVFAVVCIHDGLVPLATAALRVAYDNHPEHTLSRLMLAALNQGKSKELMDTLRRGVASYVEGPE